MVYLNEWGGEFKSCKMNRKKMYVKVNEKKRVIEWMSYNNNNNNNNNNQKTD